MNKQPRYKLELTHKQLAEIEDFYEKRSQTSLGEGVNREDLADAFDALARINRLYVEIWGEEC